jgi:RNA polymerase sigma-70 factor (ECF subfamily)
MGLPGHTADDAALISSAQAGDSAAFAQLFDRYYSMIHAFSYRLCLSSADADDIAQDTFVRAARALGGFRGGDFRSWLFRIASNTSRDLRRGQMRRTRATDAMAVEVESASNVRRADLAPIHEALLKLPEEHRQAVALVYMEGMTHSEAARVLNCAETTISWRLYRARRQLRAELSPSRR